MLYFVTKTATIDPRIVNTRSPPLMPCNYAFLQDQLQTACESQWVWLTQAIWLRTHRLLVLAERLWEILDAQILLKF